MEPFCNHSRDFSMGCDDRLDRPAWQEAKTIPEFPKADGILGQVEEPMHLDTILVSLLSNTVGRDVVQQAAMRFLIPSLQHGADSNNADTVFVHQKGITWGELSQLLAEAAVTGGRGDAFLNERAKPRRPDE